MGKGMPALSEMEPYELKPRPVLAWRNTNPLPFSIDDGNGNFMDVFPGEWIVRDIETGLLDTVEPERFDSLFVRRIVA